MHSDFLNDTEFNVDLWFCYGSFFYGFESQLHSCQENQMELSLHNANADESKELSQFLDLILDKPKGLLRVELRVYIPEKFLKKYKLSSPVYLFTDIVPRSIDKTESTIILICSSLQGITSSNSEKWIKLVRQISQQNHPHF